MTGGPSSRIVTIHQPDFLPWLGFFDRWARSDLYIVLDDVQFIRRGWHHRDKIKTANGPTWLTVPIQKKGRFEQTIRETEIDYRTEWTDKHLATLRHAYSKAPIWSKYQALLEGVYSRRPERLMDLNMELLTRVAGCLGVRTPVLFASGLGVKETSSRRLLELVLAVGGTAYLTGTGSKGYLETETFDKAGIETIWQEYQAPPYPQLHGEFAPGLSVIDYLFMTDGKGLTGRGDDR